MEKGSEIASLLSTPPLACPNSATRAAPWTDFIRIARSERDLGISMFLKLRR